MFRVDEGPITIKGKRTDPLLLFFWSLLVLGVMGSLAQAQDVQVSALVDTDTLGVQDQLQLTISISGKRSGDAETPRLPSLQGLRVVAGPSVSTQFQWINGQTTSTKSFTYVLTPDRIGQFRIDPIDVQVGDRIYKTQPIVIQVTNAPPSARTPRSPFPDPFADEDLGLKKSRIGGEDVFITAEIDRASAYPGQQVTLSYHLFTQVSVSGLQLQESPPLTGFWVEDLKVEPNPSGQRTVINGRDYLEYVVKKQALFPNAPGRLKIPPATFAISARVSGDFFGLFGRNETLYRKTKEVPLEVHPLPSERLPAGFGNAVGSFNLTANLNKTEVAAGDAVSLFVKLSGRGNLKMIPDLPLPAMPDFTIYSSKRTEDIRPFQGDLIGGDKSWEYVIVPKAPGKQTIPSLTISYFDPNKESYQTVTTPPLILNVLRGSAGTGMVTGLSGITKQNLTRQGTDINFIKLFAGNLAGQASPPYRSGWFLGLAFLAVAFNAGALYYRREVVKRSQDVGLFRSRKARRAALHLLRAAEKAGREGSRRFYDEAAAALSRYLSDRFGLPEIALAADTLERTLKEKKIDSDLIRETIACLQECDFGRFASASVTPDKMRELSRRIQKTIDALERV
jgi:hypothetical protein